MEALLQHIPVSKILPNPDNPRKETGDTTELAGSIKSVGILQPLVVMPNGKEGHFLLVCGSRRLDAAKKAKLSEVPAIVREDLDEKTALEVMLVENLQREDITPLEEALTFQKLIEECGYTQRQLADRVGRSQAHISKRLTLLDLPETVQKQVEDGKLGVGDAVEIAKLKDQPELMAEAADAVVEEDSYRGSTAGLVKRMKEDAARLDKIKAVTEKAEAEGITVIEGNHYGKAVTIGPNTYEGYEKVKVAEHKKLDCHAIEISWNGSVVPLCTKPDNHKDVASKGARTSTTKSAAQTKEDRERKELKEASKARAEVVTDILSRRVAKTGLVESLVCCLIDHAHHDALKIALGFLQVEMPESKDVSMRDILQSYAEESADNSAKAGFALMAAEAEQTCRTPWATTWDSQLSVLDYFDRLQAQGYKPSKIEEKKLGG